jgi:hypothetical protein
VYGRPATLDTRKRSDIALVIVFSVVIAGIAELAVVGARQRRPLGSESPDQWKTERDTMRAGPPGYKGLGTFHEPPDGR